jgi:signal transduction histidine kinase/ligand-binding sensor domain-containing protein
MQLPSSRLALINRYARSIAVFAMLQVCGAAQPAYAQRQMLRQMDHAMWSARDGAPQVISHLAQDRDGTLWIGSDTGLFNFDGQTFRRFQSPAGQPAFPAAQVNSLLITKDGTLWVGFSQSGAARIMSGRVTLFSRVESEPLVIVTQLREAPDGSIWAIANRLQLIRFGPDGRWLLESTPSSSRVGGIYVDSANTLWLAQGGFLHRRPLAQASYTRTAVPADVVYDFLETSEGDIWINDFDTTAPSPRMQQIDSRGTLLFTVPKDLFMHGRLAYAAGSLIVGSESYGLRRLSREEMFSSMPGRLIESDVFTREQGLSSNATLSLLIDSQGSIWIGGNRGLDRLRPAQLTPYTTADARWSVCSNQRGQVWITQSNGLLPVFGSEPQWLPATGDVYSVACANDGRVWFVDTKGIWMIASRQITALPSIAGVRPYGVTRIVLASDYSLYATVSGSIENGGGIWRYRDGRWTRLPGELAVAGFAYLDKKDRLWIGYPAGRITLHRESTSQDFWSGEPGLGRVTAFLDTAHGLWVAGNGLAILRDSQFKMLTFAEPSAALGVRGIVEARNGDLWLNSGNGLTQIPAKELALGLEHTTYPMKVRVIKQGDFAGALQTVSGYMDTAARDQDGRLWFATRSGVVHLDPERTTASRPPIVTIRSIVADGQQVRDNRVVSGTRTLAIHYLGVNLTAPESVIYRYRLQGYDESWQEAGRRTEAIFTRLPPGTYTFSVTASNGDGEWTEPVSLPPLTVLPSFYQTWWFAAAMVGLTMMAVAVVYQIRVRQIARVMNARFDERLAERTRVARELHDTLLQTVHGSKLVADRALRDTDDRTRLVGALEQVSVWLGQAATEGRAALQSLRSSSAERSDLAAAFQRAIDECQHESEATMPFSVHGQTRDVHPVIGDEVFRIGYEAIRNACHHAHATRISVTLEYGQDLTLQVNDDGVGIDAGVIETGKEGHFGLRGMRERAERISARLTVVSTGFGTAITLTVPGHVAFRLT